MWKYNNRSSSNVSKGQNDTKYYSVEYWSGPIFDQNGLQDKIQLTLKTLDFLLPIQHWGGLNPSVKLDLDVLDSLS